MTQNSPLEIFQLSVHVRWTIFHWRYLRDVIFLNEQKFRAFLVQQNSLVFYNFYMNSL